MTTWSEYETAWAKHEGNSEHSLNLYKYITSLVPILSMIVPLLFVDEETYRNTDFSVYTKLFITTILAMVAADFKDIIAYMSLSFPFIKNLFGYQQVTFVRFDSKDMIHEGIGRLLDNQIIQIKRSQKLGYMFTKTQQLTRNYMSCQSLIYIKELNIELCMVFYNNVVYLGHTDLAKIQEVIVWVKINKGTDNSNIYKLIREDTKLGDDKSKSKSTIQQDDSTNVSSTQIKTELSGKNKSDLSKCILSESNDKLLKESIVKFTDEKYTSKLESLGINNNLFMLFYGVPGTSKTTISMGIASFMQRDVLVVDKTDPDMFFQYASQIDYSKYVILMDDIDFWDMSSREEGKNKNLLRLMELLNGNTFTDGCIIFTTNHVDKFDSALFREGRVHLKLHITPMITKTMWDKFFINIFGVSTDEYMNGVEMEKLCSQEIPLCAVSELAKSYFTSIDTFILQLKNKYNL